MVFDPELLAALHGEPSGNGVTEHSYDTGSDAPRATITRATGEEDAAPLSSPEVYQIPRKFWTVEKQKQVADYLDAELQLADMERSEKMAKFADYLVAYKAPSANYPKNFPIANASNLTIPVIKEIVNTLVAQIVQSTLTSKPRWILEDLAAEWEPFVDDIEQFLDIAAERDLGFEVSALNSIIEMCKLGTSVLETVYEVDERNIYKYTADGRKVYKDKMLFQDGPVVIHCPLQRFWIRFHEREIQKARWVAKQLTYTSYELFEKESQGKFYGIKDLIRTVRSSQYVNRDEVEEAEREAELTKPSFYDSWEIFEVWLFWDVDGDGSYEHLVLYYSREGRKFIGCKFNPYWHGKRPFTKIGYFPGPGFYDEGLCEMLEDIQKGISMKTNTRNDNESLANIKMILKRKMIKGLMPGDPLYSGKIIEVNDIWNDVREFQLNEIYPSTVQGEMLLWQRAERLSGVSEAQTGGAMPVTRTTAAAQLALLQEQAKRVDLAVRVIRVGFNEIGYLATQLYFQFGTNGKAVAWLGKRGQAVEAIFRLPRRIVELGLAIKAETPTSIQNRQVKRENSIALLNLLIQIHEKLMPFAQLLAPDRMGEVAHGMVRAANRYLSDTLETFETPDPEELLAGLTILEKVLPAPENLGGMAAYERAAATDKDDAQLARLEGLLRSVESFGAGSDRLPDRGRERGRLEAPERVPRGRSSGIEFGGPPEQPPRGY